MITISLSYAQPNCEAFLYYYKDTLKYHACKKTEETAGFYQFEKAYQDVLDEAINIDPSFDYSYRRKSTAYLKSGDFINWKCLMDKAVFLNPQENLEHRAAMRFKCFKDYHGALSDFNKLEDLGLQVDHLAIIKALCYNALGDNGKAIQLLEMQLDKGDDFFGLYGYLHLGVFYLEQKDYAEAKKFFLLQSSINELAENQFYLALTYKGLKMQVAYKHHIEAAMKLYLQERYMSDLYVDLHHRIYLEDFERERAFNK